MANLKRGRVAHVVPGRVRIRLDRQELSGSSGAQLRAALLTLPGIADVRVTPQTGSVVIFHDPAEFDAPGLIALARTANLLALDALDDDPYGRRSKPMSETASSVHRTFHSVDMRVAEITAGRWDLRSVVPLALGALALRAALRDFGAIGTAPWYVFAWYAFDSFWKLNQGPATTSPPERSDDLRDGDE